MGWYVVIKNIKGIAYRYRQRTWRENGSMRTESVYVGRADSVGRGKVSASNGTRTIGTIKTAVAPAAIRKTTKQISKAAREPPAAKTVIVSEALAEYDRLALIAQALYAQTNSAANEDYENVYGQYLRAKDAITTHQSKVLGEKVTLWGGGDGADGARVCRKEFEDALIEKRDGKNSKPPRSRKMKVPDRLPANGDFSGEFWDTPHSPEHLRDQASLYYKEYLIVKARCDAYHVRDVSSWQAARTDKARLSELQSQLAWYEGKCRSWFDRKIVFSKSRVTLKENE